MYAKWVIQDLHERLPSINSDTVLLVRWPSIV